jgi:hypothetical protein
MATTTNYSWATPDDTALVKDGAAAIRSLGSAIDSTVFTNASAAIAKTIVDAKGDLIAATAADTVARLAVGSNNQVLVADSSTATGLKWATPAGGKVLQVINATYSTSKTITSTTYTATDLTASITPSSITSKILVLVNTSQSLSRNATGDPARGFCRLMRDSTVVPTGAEFQTGIFAGLSGSGNQQVFGYVGISYLDSPATTSAVTYSLQGKLQSTADQGQIVFNGTQQGGTATSTITLLEIGA